jgi:putative tryptophan/tyrosine transport system substrate-binding protein
VAIGGVAAAALPLAARAQQPVPVVGFINARSAEGSAHFGAVFRKGLVAGQNVTVEYHCLDGRCDRLPSLMTSHVGFRCVARNRKEGDR